MADLCFIFNRVVNNVLVAERVLTSNTHDFPRSNPHLHVGYLHDGFGSNGYHDYRGGGCHGDGCHDGGCRAGCRVGYHGICKKIDYVEWNSKIKS